MTLAPGTPWPDAEHGEVVSPSGQRAYLAVHAAELARRSPRWATDLARGDNAVRAEQGHVIGRQGGKAWFLLAEDFERYLVDQNAWPPPAHSAGEASDLEHLAQLQGVDLEAARRENAELKEEVARLTGINNQLLEQIVQLAQIAKTPPHSGSRPPASGA